MKKRSLSLFAKREARGLRRDSHGRDRLARRLRLELLEARRLLFSTGVAGFYQIHQDITADAMPFLNAAVLGNIQAADKLVDSADSSGGHFSDPQYHFDSCFFSDAAKVINDEYNIALAAANPRSFDSAKIADAFGTILHVAQDFYAHTNWADLIHENLLPAGSLIDQGSGLWDGLSPYSVHDGVMIVQGKSEQPTTPYGQASSLTLSPRSGLDTRQ